MATAIDCGRLVVMGLVWALFALAVQAEDVGGFVLESSKAATLDNCVEPTEYMRRNHMELIRHQRDTTVYGGIRSTKHSMAGCVTCHVGYGSDRQPLPVNGDHQFCEACHDYVAVTLNCFDCHATVPEGESWNQEVAIEHTQRDERMPMHVADVRDKPDSPLGEGEAGVRQ
ncbi:MAG: sulfur reduction protein DsrJ [Thiohalocapsa sp.]